MLYAVIYLWIALKLYNKRTQVSALWCLYDDSRHSAVIFATPNGVGCLCYECMDIDDLSSEILVCVCSAFTRYSLGDPR